VGQGSTRAFPPQWYRPSPPPPEPPSGQRNIAPKNFRTYAILGDKMRGTKLLSLRKIIGKEGMSEGYSRGQTVRTPFPVFRASPKRYGGSRQSPQRPSTQDFATDIDSSSDRAPNSSRAAERLSPAVYCVARFKMASCYVSPQNGPKAADSLIVVCGIWAQARRAEGSAATWRGGPLSASIEG